MTQRVYEELLEFQKQIKMPASATSTPLEVVE
jgi:hypothetical protein